MSASRMGKSISSFRPTAIPGCDSRPGEAMASVRERPEGEKHRTEVTEATEEEIGQGL
jgi:hypothetical protein